MVTTGYINLVLIGWQAKKVQPYIRLVKNETPGRYGSCLDSFKEGGLDITVDIIAMSQTEKDNIVSAFMQRGRSKLGLGGVDVGWFFSGKCSDRSSDLTISDWVPSETYPLSFGFTTDEPFLLSEMVHSRARTVSGNGEKWTTDDCFPDNLLDNYTFKNWSSPTGVNAVTGGGSIAAPTANTRGIVYAPYVDKIYVANSGTNNVSVIDANTNGIVATVAVGVSPYGTCVTPNGAFVYVANSGGDTVSKINTATDTVVTSITVGLHPYGVACSPDGFYVYVTDFDANTVSKINVSTNAIVTTYNVGTNPKQIAIRPDNGEVYVINSGSAGVTAISIINPANGQIATMNYSSAVKGIAFSPDSRTAYVLYGNYSFSIMDTATHTEIMHTGLAAGTGMVDIAVPSDGTRLYIINTATPQLTIIDIPKTLAGGTGTYAGVISTTSLAYTPSMMAVNPRGDLVYISSNNTATYLYYTWQITPDNWILTQWTTGISKNVSAYHDSVMFSPFYINNSLGQLSQPAIFKAGVTYRIGCLVNLQNHVAGACVLELQENGVAILSDTSTVNDGNWEMLYFYYTPTTVLKNLTINIRMTAGSAYPERGYFSRVYVNEYDLLEYDAFGNAITTSGPVPTIPDVIVAGCGIGTGSINQTGGNIPQTVVDHTVYTYTGTDYTNSGGQFVLKSTITLTAKAGIATLITGIGLKLKSSSSLYSASGVISIQSPGLWAGAEKGFSRWVTSQTSYQGCDFLSLRVQAPVNTVVYVKLYMWESSASGTASVDDFYATWVGGFVGNYQLISDVFPANLQICNTADKTTKLDVANVLYPGSVIRINADGTGTFRYEDSFNTNMYSLIVSGPQTGITYSSADRDIAITYGNTVTYPFDIKHPIAGCPTLILWVEAGTPLVKIQNYSGSSPLTAYTIDEYSTLVTADTLESYDLINAQNCNLAGSTRFDILITSLTASETLKLKGIYLYCDLITIDAEHPEILPDCNNEFEVLMDNEASCNVAFIYRDKKWGI